MFDTPALLDEIRAFGETWEYDAGYLADLLEASPAAFEAFRAAQGMSYLADALPLDARSVASVSAMQFEDCGACAQLNVRMALAAGTERELLTTLVEHPERLPAILFDVREHVRDVCEGRAPDPDTAARLRAAYGEAGFAELAVLIAGCRIYPTVKRALLRAGTCEILRVPDESADAP